MGASTVLVSDAGAMIRATADHLGLPATGDLALFLDCDLSILGAEQSEYERYSAAIRREFAFVPDELYRVGRAGVLQRFLAAKPLYRTDAMRERFEQPAKQNLQAELAALASPR